jgi:hypothetical protein
LIFFLSGEGGFFDMLEVWLIGEEFEDLVDGEEDFFDVFWFLFPE